MPASSIGLKDFRDEGILHRLPPVRGKLEAAAPLSPQTWFRVGGPAEILFKPADEEDLAAFLAATPADIPVTVIGVASNLLIRDGGIRGVVVKLGPQFAQIRADGMAIMAGAAALDLNVARAAAQAGIGGLEFMSGIPGTVGGGLRMNAGAYGREFKDAVAAVTALDREGKRRRMDNAACEFSYRHSGLPADWIFLGAEFHGVANEPDLITAKMQEIQAARGATQPIREKTGGSTFANPAGNKAWQLIDSAGCRGLRIGGAEMSPQHCNFIVNTGDATAADIENLGEEVRARVRSKFNVDLHWEIVRIGVEAQGSQPCA
ncbi:MAG: UDP-N-acetylmuramate dehydrogenase [Alphaproteobacteria bacterium]